MRAIRTCVVIADGARARFLESQGRGRALTAASLPELSREARPTREIGSERPGRVHDRQGPGRHALAPRVDWHEFEKTAFAGEVAALLNAAARGKAFDRLVLVAPPKTLGALRGALDKQTAALVTGELGKDLTNHPLSELPRHLTEALW